MPGRRTECRQMSRFRGRVIARRLVILCALLAAFGFLGAGSALVVERQSGPPDAVLMLASHEWERLPAAAALARRYPQAVVLLTVPVAVSPENCHRCSERVAWLAAEGVAAERVRVLPRVANTYGEALAARQYARSAQIAILAVVTSPYHTRRALSTFTEVFADSSTTIDVVQALPSDAHPRTWWLHRKDRWYVAYEWAANLKYRWAYGIPLVL